MTIVGESGRPTRTRGGGRRARAAAPLVPIVVFAEVVLALGLLIWAVSGSRLGWVALIVAAGISLMVIPWRGGTSVSMSIARRLGFEWARIRRDPADLASAPFDIPTGASPRSGSRAGTDAPPIGARWAGDMLITALRIRPGTVGATRLVAGSATPDDTPGMQVPLDVLAECIDPFDIPLWSIDVVSHGSRIRGRGNAAATYLPVLGRLPVTAQRGVLVILRLDPRTCPEAIARRGGGAVGALRAATITTRRVARRLGEHGLDVAALTAAEMTTITNHLTAGHDLGEIVEDWAELRTPREHMRIAAVTPEALPEVAAGIWAWPTAATTLTIRLTHTADGALQVCGVVRLDDAAETDLPAGLQPLPGRQFDGLTVGLPVASPTRLHRRLPAAHGSRASVLLERMTLSAGGCGQLIGADDTGRAVALPLVGAGVAVVALSGTQTVVAQTILRTVAIGAPVRIHTDDPRRWLPLIEAVADTLMLNLADTDHLPSTGARVDLFDGVAPPADSPPIGLTRYVRTPDDDVDAGRIRSSADVIIRQNPLLPQQLSVSTAHTRIQLTLVATPAEWALIGAQPTGTTQLTGMAQR